jgi:hypothetical protein
MAVRYKIFLHTNMDQPNEINQKNIFMTRRNITYKADHRLDSNKKQKRFN